MLYIFLSDVEKVCLNVHPNPDISDEQKEDILDTIKHVKYQINHVMDSHLEQSARNLVTRVGNPNKDKVVSKENGGD